MIKQKRGAPLLVLSAILCAAYVERGVSALIKGG